KAALTAATQHYQNECFRFKLDRGLARSLEQLAINAKVTVNTVVQALWGILIANCNNTRDVVFGIVVSGRPTEIPEVESMVGLFINTIPLRIRFDEQTSFLELVSRIQQNSIDGEKHQHYPLPDIQADSLLKQGLIDHILTFENYPLEQNIEGLQDAFTEDRQQLNFSGVEILEQTNYDFNLIVVPHEGLELKFLYNANRYDETLLTSLKNQFQKLAQLVVQNPTVPVSKTRLLALDESDAMGNYLNKQIKSKEYWQTKLAGNPEKSVFPPDQELLIKKWKKEEVLFSFSPAVTDALLHLANASSQRLHIVLTAGLITLVNKYTGNADIVVGTPVYRQDKSGDPDTAELLVRTAFNETLTFKDLVLNVHHTMSEALDHRGLSAERIAGLLNVPAGEPLYDIGLVLEDIQDRAGLREGGCSIVFAFTKRPGGLAGQVTYNGLLYSRSYVERITRHFNRLLEGIFADKNRTLGRVDILNKEESFQLLAEFNNTVSVDTGKNTVLEMLAEQVERQPGQVALKYRDQVLTYGQVGGISNQVARLLRERYGVAPEDRIGLVLDRSDKMVLSLLGVLKSGGAYVPIDPGYPAERIAYIIRDSNCRFLIADGKYQPELRRSSDVRVVTVEEIWGEMAAVSNLDLTQQAGAGQLAYVLYTSGSTGNPKGCQLEHRNLSNYVAWANGYYFEGGDGGHFPLYSSLSFDFTVTSIFCALT
ncbi:MAG: AMP-binding protein, partial [Cytophagales bacterium]|nr:AMP-binding protein [Cytophagales bacterium]